MFIKKQIAKLTLFCLLTTLFLGVKINPQIGVYASTTNKMNSIVNSDISNSTTSSAAYMTVSNNYARSTSNSIDYNWNFNIVEVMDPMTGMKPNYINGNYVLQGRNVVINTEYYATTSTKKYVYVNEVFVDEGNEECGIYDFSQNGYSHYTAYELKNLHTGVNTIRVRAYKPYTLDFDRYYYGKDYKDDTITVIVPGNIDESIKNINLGTAYIGDYEFLGINGVTSSNLNTINNAILVAREEKGSDLTQSEIEELVLDTINGREVAIKEIIEGKGTINDYQLIGVTSVKEENLEDVNWYLKEQGITNEQQIKSKVNTIINALDAINNGTTSISYYTTLGITTVTSSNASNVKTAILVTKKEKGSNLTRTEIENIVLNLSNIREKAIKEIIEGKGTINDYQLIGVTTIKEENLEDVNWYLKEKRTSNETEIKNNVKTVISALSNINSGTTSISYYKTLGITTVTSSNASNVKTAILVAKKEKGSNLTRAEIGKVAENAANIREAAIKEIIEGKGTINDYQLIGITTVKEENLEDVNWYLKEKRTSNETEIKNNVKTVISALSNINSGTTSISYYKTLGITTVTSSNASNVKTAILAAKKEKGSNLTRAEIGKVAENAAKIREAAIKEIIEGKGTINDYQLIGVTTVKEENLEDVNWYLKEKGTSNEAEIKSNVKTVISALSNINSGTTSTSYYKTLGITTVTSSNASNVKKAILAAKKEKGSNLIRAEIVKIVSNTI